MTKCGTKNSQPQRANKEDYLNEYRIWSGLDLLATALFPASVGLSIFIIITWLLALLPSGRLVGSMVDDVIGIVLPLPIYLLKRKAKATCAELKRYLLE